MISSVPIYDYRCEHCGHAFSALQSYNDDALSACPSCGKQPRRLIAPPAIVFKGSGWYKTDSRPKPASETASPGTKDGAKDATKSDAKSDTRPDAKPDTKSDTKSETKSSSGSSGKSDAAS